MNKSNMLESKQVDKKEESSVHSLLTLLIGLIFEPEKIIKDELKKMAKSFNIPIDEIITLFNYVKSFYSSENFLQLKSNGGDIIAPSLNKDLSNSFLKLIDALKSLQPGANNTSPIKLKDDPIKYNEELIKWQDKRKNAFIEYLDEVEGIDKPSALTPINMKKKIKLACEQLSKTLPKDKLKNEFKDFCKIEKISKKTNDEILKKIENLYASDSKTALGGGDEKDKEKEKFDLLEELNKNSKPIHEHKKIDYKPKSNLESKETTHALDVTLSKNVELDPQALVVRNPDKEMSEYQLVVLEEKKKNEKEVEKLIHTRDIEMEKTNKIKNNDYNIIDESLTKAAIDEIIHDPDEYARQKFIKKRLELFEEEVGSKKPNRSNKSQYDQYLLNLSTQPSEILNGEHGLYFLFMQQLEQSLNYLDQNKAVSRDNLKYLENRANQRYMYYENLIKDPIKDLEDAISLREILKLPTQTQNDLLITYKSSIKAAEKTKNRLLSKIEYYSKAYFAPQFAPMVVLYQEAENAMIDKPNVENKSIIEYKGGGSLDDEEDLMNIIHEMNSASLDELRNLWKEFDSIITNRENYLKKELQKAKNKKNDKIVNEIEDELAQLSDILEHLLLGLEDQFDMNNDQILELLNVQD